MSMKAMKRMGKLRLYIIYIIVAAFFLFPILWTLSMSLKSVQELYEVPPSLLPDRPMFENYEHVLIQSQFLRAIGNSLLISLFTILGTLFVSIPAAYCFSRMRFRGSKTLQFIILMFQMISPLVVVVPLYQYFSKINMLNTFSGVIMICIAISAPFQVWFLKGFMDTIPKALDEAATIDGCTPMMTLTRVILPVIAPGILSSVLLIFISSWSQFIVPYILIDKTSMMTVAVRLVNLQSSLHEITTHYLAAASIVSIFPIILIFATLQRYIVSALTAGAVKG